MKYEFDERGAWQRRQPLGKGRKENNKSCELLSPPQILVRHGFFRDHF